MNNFKCNVCHREFSKRNHLTHHVSSSHGINSKDYTKNNISDFISEKWKLCIDCGVYFKGRSKKCGVCYSKNHIVNDQFIICRYCNDSIHSKVLSQHLKKNHSVSFEDYLKENLEDFRKFGWDRCAICGTITKKRGKKHRPTCSRKCVGQLKKIEYSGRIGVNHTEKTKEKISILAKKRFKDKTKHPMFGKHHIEESKKRISEKAKVRLSNPENNPMFGRTHTPETIRKIMSHRPMNKLEKIVADELNRRKLRYTFQFFITDKGVCKSYDFKLTGKPLIIEVDGDFWHGNPNTKSHHLNVKNTKKNDRLKEKIAKSRGYKVLRFWESDIKKDSSIIPNKLREYLFI